MDQKIPREAVEKIQKVYDDAKAKIHVLARERREIIENASKTKDLSKLEEVRKRIAGL